MPNTTNGLPYPSLTDDNNPPADIQELAVGVDAAYGRSVASSAALPGTGAFPGQRIWLVDVKGWSVWSGSAWVSDTAWVTPTLSGAWVSFGGGYAPPRYLRKAGVVHIEGVARSGTGTIFTLPSGMRPSAKLPFIQWGGGGGSVITITDLGVVAVDSYFASGNNNYVSLSITFPADQ